MSPCQCKTVPSSASAERHERIPSGVIVAARTLGSGTTQVPLQTGDVIHSVNGTMIMTLEELRDALAAQKPGDAIVLQIDRYGQLVYISFSL